MVGMSLPSIACPPRIGSLVWVYILETADHTYYIGQSRDVGRRLREHRLGIGSKHTADHGGPFLVYVEGPFSLRKAVARERQLKGWTRAKKEALIAGDFAQLRALSQSRASARHQ